MEWCWDWYTTNITQLFPENPQVPLTDSQSCEGRRGFKLAQHAISESYRHYLKPETGKGLGFRLVRTIGYQCDNSLLSCKIEPIPSMN
jgi:hypothetical protein